MALTAEEKTTVIGDVKAAVVDELKKSGSIVIMPPPPAPPPPKPKDDDPYRPMLQFITGLLAFCLTLIAALFAALGLDKGHAANAAVMWVLLGMIAAASFGTIAALLLQLGKSKSRDKFDGFGEAGVGAAVVAVALGVAAAGYGGLHLWQERDVTCMKVAESVSDQGLKDLLVKNGKDAKYAEDNMKDCFATGDLPSSAAWSKAMPGPAMPVIQAPQ